MGRSPGALIEYGWDSVGSLMHGKGLLDLGGQGCKRAGGMVGWGCCRLAGEGLDRVLP